MGNVEAVLLLLAVAATTFAAAAAVESVAPLRRAVVDFMESLAGVMRVVLRIR